MVSHDRTKLKLSHSAWNDNSPDIYLVSLVQSLTEQPSPAWDSSPSSPSLQSAAGLPSLAHCASSCIHFNVNTFLMLLFSSRPSNIFIPFSTCVLLNSQEISNFIIEFLAKIYFIMIHMSWKAMFSKIAILRNLAFCEIFLVYVWFSFWGRASLSYSGCSETS